MEWISVKNKIPYPYHYVFVAAPWEDDELFYYSIARITVNGIWEMLSTQSESNAVACGDLTWYMDPNEITHWMPLPKSPK